MVPNPLSTTDSAPADAAARRQLKLAARTTQDVRDQTQMATSAVINDEVHRSHGQWRRTLDTVKETLASLEHTCESAIEAQEAGVAGLIDTLVRSAAAEAVAAAQQTRAQAQIEMAKLQAEMAERQTVADGLQADLHVERDRLKSTNEQLDIEVGSRVRAESERDEARRVCQQVASAAESQVQGLRAESDAQKAELTSERQQRDAQKAELALERQQRDAQKAELALERQQRDAQKAELALARQQRDAHKTELALARQQRDAARAECSTLMATFQSVQRVLSLGPLDDRALEGENTERDLVTPAESRPQEIRAENSSDTTPAPAGLASSPIADEKAAVIEAPPEAVEDVKQVLEQVETMYWLDLNSGRSPMEVVDSLTGNLRYAREVTLARSSLRACDAETLFEEQIAVLLDLKAGTTFARHLSISAYASRRPAASVQGESSTTQQTVA